MRALVEEQATLLVFMMIPSGLRRYAYTRAAVWVLTAAKADVFLMMLFYSSDLQWMLLMDSCSQARLCGQCERAGEEPDGLAEWCCRVPS
jgi:hypothetical protein